jgi:hypothetical protein
MLLLPGAVSTADLGRMLAAERTVWDDAGAVAQQLANRTRRLSGSRAQQSVTWLHRHRGAAGGAIERVEQAALEAERCVAGPASREGREP